MVQSRNSVKASNTIEAPYTYSIAQLGSRFLVTVIFPQIKVICSNMSPV